MNENEKTPFVELSSNDKQRYLTQMKEFEDNGYFTLQDGSKSTDFSGKSEVKKRAKLNQSQDLIVNRNENSNRETEKKRIDNSVSLNDKKRKSSANPKAKVNNQTKA